MTKMMIDHKLVYDWYMASPGDHLCSVYAWYTGNFPFGIRLVYGAVLFGIRVDFFTYSLVYGLSLVRYTRGIRWYTVFLSFRHTESIRWYTVIPCYMCRFDMKNREHSNASDVNITGHVKKTNEV